MSSMMGRLFRQFFEQQGGLTERQQQLIHTSLAKLRPVQDTATAMFRERLFALDPWLGALFNSENERTKLMTAISTVVDQSHHLKQLAPTLRELGRRYDDWGMTDRNYNS